jgi:predicted nucleic acid-binding Zn ribbon protein
VVEEDHRHCKVCGKVCAVGEETCSKACRTKRAAQLQKRQTYTYLIYAMIALIAIVFLLSFR